MIFQLPTELADDLPQLQVLWDGCPERNAMLVDRFRNVQIRAGKINAIKNSAVGLKSRTTILFAF